MITAGFQSQRTDYLFTRAKWALGIHSRAHFRALGNEGHCNFSQSQSHINHFPGTMTCCAPYKIKSLAGFNYQQLSLETIAIVSYSYIGPLPQPLVSTHGLESALFLVTEGHSIKFACKNGLISAMPATCQPATQVTAAHFGFGRLIFLALQNAAALHQLQQTEQKSLHWVVCLVPLQDNNVP